MTIEEALSKYLLTVALINFALGLIIVATLWLTGFPNPAHWRRHAAASRELFSPCRSGAG